MNALILWFGDTLAEFFFWAECVFCRKFSDVTISRYPILIETVIYDQKCVRSFVDTIFLANTTSRWGSSCFSCVFQRCFSTISCWIINKNCFWFESNCIYLLQIFSLVLGTFSSASFSLWPSFVRIELLYILFSLVFDVKHHSELQV